jgi:hypothetical protein
MTKPSRVRQDHREGPKKGQPLVNQTTATPQAVQARTAAALASLLGEHPNAPLVSWSLQPGRMVLPNLVGQVPTADDATDRAVVAAWATILGAEVVEEAKHLKATGERWTDVRASSDTGGIRIDVWAMCDHTRAEAVAA